MMPNNFRVKNGISSILNSSSNPLLIRRIEELNKTANGNVEAKVVCFYRRRDISSTLIALADKHFRCGPAEDGGGELEEEMENPEMRDLPEKQKHQLRHRELFLSRQLESLPATHIRGKCCVTLLNETEALKSYLDREDAFFYSLVYDPQQKTLLADKGEIRVGNKYQADITDLLKEGTLCLKFLNNQVGFPWQSHCGLTMIIHNHISHVSHRSVGTFARALDCSSSVRQPSLHMSAAAASRDITLFHAMDTLHATGYDMTRAIAALVPQGGPVLCRDEMEEWSASEANLFEEALEKYGKDFTDIQQDFVSGKTVGFDFRKHAFVLLGTAGTAVPGPPGSVPTPGLGRACESCYTSSSYQWYSWGPPNMQCRLCASCWTYWKKYGGLKMPTRLDGERPGPNRNNMSPHGLPLRHSGSPKFAVKTRQAFYLQTTSLTRMARRTCQDIIRPRYMARHPYLPVNTAAIKAECALRLPDRPKKPLPLKPVERKPLESVVRYLEAHPRPSKPNPPTRGGSISTGSLTPIKSSPILNNGSPTILGKRTYEQHNGLDGEPDRLETLKHIYNLHPFASSASKNFIFTELFVTTTIEDYFHLQWYIFGSMSLFLHLSTLPHRYVENQKQGEQHQGFRIEQSRLGWGWVAMWLADVQHLWAGRNISAFKSVSLNSAHAQVMLDMLNIVLFFGC
uniref:Metastasis associated 1 n=1 Tax=Neolamprologus brichardi TaxID=32507 RepID=A0A3Q4H2C3_NEOBR